MTVEERNEMAQKNEGLIHECIKRFANLGVPREDLFQEGYIALLLAVEGWDPEKGKLSTYATMAINNALKRYVINDVAIPIPEYLNRQMQGVAEAVKRLEGAGVVVTPEALSLQLEVTLDDAKELYQYYQKRNVGSTNAVVSETGDEVGTLLADDEPSVEDQVVNNGLGKYIHDTLVEIYGERKAEIACYYYGVGYDTSHTLEECGKKFGVTRERVRQLLNLVQGVGNGGKRLTGGNAERYRRLRAALADFS